MSRPDLPEHLRTEELYRSAVELAPDSIITVDMKGVITSSNTAATRILGYSKDELVGRHFSKIGVIRARDVPKFAKLFKSALRGELIEPLGLTFYRKDGPPILAEVRVGLLKENGKTIGLQAVSRDITKRRQAEEALRESEERLSVFMDSAPDAFALFDSELNLVEINRVGLRMLPDGSKKEGVIGKNIAELYPTMKETGRYDKYLEVVETGKSFFVDDVVPHPKFGDGHLAVRAFKVGEGLGIIVTDITERKRAEEGLQRLKQFNEGIVQGVAEAILIEDASGIITFVNPALEELLGYTSDELAGRHWRMIVPEEEIELVHAKTSLRPEGTGDRYETRLLAKDGHEIPVIVSAQPLFEEETFTGVLSAFSDITERKRAEEALKESEEKFRTLAERSPNMIFINKKGRVVYANEKCEEMMGCKREEFYSPDFDFLTLIAPEYIDLVKANFSRHMKGEEVPPYEYALVTREGKRIEAIYTTRLIRYEAESAILGIITDITERKRAEEKLHYQANLLKSVSDAIISTDVNFNIQTWNKAAETIYGWKTDEVMGKPVHEVTKLEYPYDRMEDVVEEFFEKGYWKGEVIQKCKDGTPINILASVTLVRDSAGSPVAAVAVNRDITERKRAEEALRESEEKYRTILENIQEGYFEVDIAGNFTFFNDSLCRIVGYPRDEMMGMNNRQYMDKENAKKVFQAFNRVYTTGKPTEQFSWEIIRKDGTRRFAEASASLMRNSEGEPIGFRGIVRDITERKQAEEALHHSLEETARGQRLLLALSQAAEAVQRARTLDEVYGTIGHEVTKLGYHAAIFTVTDDRAHLAISHLTFESASLRAAEKLAGFSAQDYRFPLVPGGFFHGIIAEGETTFAEPTARHMAEALPRAVRPLAGRLAALLGLEQSILAPLRVGGETHGLLTVTGSGLTERDVSAVTAFANQAAIAIQNARLYGDLQTELTQRKRAEKGLEHTLEKLRKALGATIQAMALTVEAKDAYTAGHQRRATNLARTIATKMGLSEEQIDGIRLAGVIHDIGKISVPGEILSKPGRLTDIEFSLIKTHPQVGYDILKPIEFPWPVAQIVLQHHERIDGSGYPAGLKGDEIMLEARILAVADVVEAMCSHRPYRPAHSIDEALGEIRQNRGILYDPDVVDACLSLFSDEGFKLERA